MHERLTAALWDFDGTLVDTRRKNMNVTRAIVEHLHTRSADDFEALRSLQDYEAALHRHRHWHDFYRLELDITNDQIRRAEGRWLEFQAADDTPADPYEGIREAVDAFGHVPQGIVSLNSESNIDRFLRQLDMRHHFGAIFGHESVETGRQKPHPDALIRCIEALTGGRPGFVMYVGDHETDIECAHRANDHFESLGTDVRVISIGALYAPHHDDGRWEARPDCRAEHPSEIVHGLAEILAGLP